MTVLTEAELLRFRRKNGDGGATQAFSDTELQDLYSEADEDFTRAVRDSFEELLGNSWKLHKYSQGASTDAQDQIFDHLVKMLAIWNKKVSSEKRQLQVVGMRTIPPVRKKVPG